MYIFFYEMSLEFHFINKPFFNDYYVASKLFILHIFLNTIPPFFIFYFFFFANNKAY